MGERTARASVAGELAGPRPKGFWRTFEACDVGADTRWVGVGSFESWAEYVIRGVLNTNGGKIIVTI